VYTAPVLVVADSAILKPVAGASSVNSRLPRPTVTGEDQQPVLVDQAGPVHRLGQRAAVGEAVTRILVSAPGRLHHPVDGEEGVRGEFHGVPFCTGTITDPATA